MKNLIFLSKKFLSIGICSLLLSCQHANQHAGNDRLPDPVIKAGIAKVTGKLSCFQLINGEPITLALYVPNPVTAEMGKFETKVNKDGSFHFEIPVECNINVGLIGSEIFQDNAIGVGLIPGEVTKLEIFYDETGNIKANMLSSLGLASGDLPHLYKMFIHFIEFRYLPKPWYTMSPEEFSHFAIEKLMEERLKGSINDSILSGKAKNLITDECKLEYLKGCLLTYSKYISLNYRNTKPKGGPDNFTPQEPKRSYYTFLKKFNLNDPQYLYNGMGMYTEVLQTILSIETLNIPAIKDTPVKEWLKAVKTNIADLIGSDTGLFYEMLAANAYAQQFNKELKPLSDVQKENIRSYFKNEEITKILLKRNEEVIKLETEKNYFKTNVNSTPSDSKEGLKNAANSIPGVSKEKLMSAIISKYKGNAVLVDFWATWCQPCMRAMKEIREIKSEMHDKNIVFVYITSVSSPKKLWEEDIKIIGGEHYYLNKDEWEYVMGKFGFEGIPSYLIYDKEGILKHKFTGYPGNDKMREMIEALLQ